MGYSSVKMVSTMDLRGYSWVMMVNKRDLMVSNSGKKGNNWAR